MPLMPSEQPRPMRRQNLCQRGGNGFTLVELLVVVSIIGVLAVLILAVAGRVTEQARAAACTSNQRSIFMGLAGYAADNNGNLPLASESSSLHVGAKSWWHHAGERLGMTDLPTNPTRFTGKTVFKCPGTATFGYPYGLYYISYGVNLDWQINPKHPVVFYTEFQTSTRPEERRTKLGLLPNHLILFGDTVASWKLRPSQPPDHQEQLDYRHNGRAVVTHPDGRVSMVTREEVQEMPEFKQ